MPQCSAAIPAAMLSGSQVRMQLLSCSLQHILTRCAYAACNVVGSSHLASSTSCLLIHLLSGPVSCCGVCLYVLICTMGNLVCRDQSLLSYSSCDVSALSYNREHNVMLHALCMPMHRMHKCSKRRQGNLHRSSACCAVPSTNITFGFRGIGKQAEQAH